jgi:hypothetical protein
MYAYVYQAGNRQSTSEELLLQANYLLDNLMQKFIFLYW